MTEYRVHILCDPTSSATGKFYIGVEHPTQPFALYGPNTNNTAGTTTRKDSVSSLQKLLDTKRRKGYSDVTETAVSRAAISNMVAMIAKTDGLPKDQLSLTKRGNSYFLSSQKSTAPQQRQAPKPKTRKKEYRVWI